jgi:protein arginine N-methyltransferase 3
MGYCLFYEAMLPSVLWARDKYLAPGGLLGPSHAILKIAPLADPDLIDEHISFWNDVYGFTMTSMLQHIYDDVLIRDVKSAAVPADAQAFLSLPLHTSNVADLSFVQKPFSFALTEDIDALDGFVIWFDTYFATSPDGADPTADGTHVLRTGVSDATTHWRQGVLLIDHAEKARPFVKGSVVKGVIGYQKPGTGKNPRHLEISMSWSVEGADGTEEKGIQVWKLE